MERAWGTVCHPYEPSFAHSLCRKQCQTLRTDTSCSGAKPTDLQNLKDRCNEQSQQQGFCSGERKDLFRRERGRNGCVEQKKSNTALLKPAEGRSESYILQIQPCGHGLPRNSHEAEEDFIDQMKAGAMVWTLARQP